LSSKSFKNQLQSLANQAKAGKVLISFDDGLEDNYTVAKSILDEFDLKATFFVSTGLIGENGYMSFDMIEELKSDGHRIGGHGHKHINYLVSNRDEIMKDLNLCFDYLSKELKEKNPWFSYPFGGRNPYTDKICRDLGFKILFSSSLGSFAELNELSVIPRIEVWNSDTIMTLKRKIQGKYNWLNKF
jgi:Predicted xylanase/chitin deacetylase